MDHANPLTIVDLAGLSSRCMRNAGLMRKVLTQLASSLPGQVESLRVALAAGDMAGVGSLAHKLKGSTATVGAEALRAEAFALEQAAKGGDAEGAGLALSRLGARAREFDGALAGVLASIDAGSPAGRGPA